MPVKIPDELPAATILADENIFIMRETRAIKQDIRPLRIAILNLMPTKIVTETQLLRLLGNTPLQVEVTLLQTASHKGTHTSAEHMLAFYKSHKDVEDQYFDGLIITGAPVEQFAFEQVEYWDELCTIMEWSKTHVYSTIHICWGAQAGLYYHYGIPKVQLERKVFGVFRHRVENKKSVLFSGFDEDFMVPHSRHTTVMRKDIAKVQDLHILASSAEAGVYAVSTRGGRQIFLTGHVEYDADTLKKEYLRDINAGFPIELPKNYFLNDVYKNHPVVSWRAHANLFYANWLNYFVYQSTPFNISEINRYDGF